MVEMMVIASMWESIAAWFTPTVLFCVTNLIIATIFIASNSNKHLHHDHADSTSTSNSNSHSTPIARVSSFLERARSIKLTSYTTAESAHQHPPQSKTANYSSSSRLAQSIYSSESEGNSVSQLARSPSFIDRVTSFKIGSAFNSGPEKVNSDPEHHVVRSKSEKKPAKKSLAEMKKSRSEVRITQDEDSDYEEDVDLRRPATTRERRSEFDEEVDAKADDFITRFKQQLKLQRLESLVRYNNMLNRRS